MPHIKMIKFSILLILFFCVYYPIQSELIHVWLEDSNNSHGLLVPFAFGYFVYQKKEGLKSYITGKNSPKPNLWVDSIGLTIFIVSLSMYVLFYIGHIAFVSRVLMLLSFISLIWYYFGLRLINILLFPLLFLFFMVPMPVSFTSYITLPMQTFATNMSVSLISIFSIPLVQEGHLVHFSTCTIEVANACSGIRSLVSMVMLGTMFAYMTKKNNFKRIVILLFSPAIAILANVMRITGTGLLANSYGDKVAKGFVHEISGILVFGFGFIILFALFKLLNKEFVTI